MVKFARDKVLDVKIAVYLSDVKFLKARSSFKDKSHDSQDSMYDKESVRHMQGGLLFWFSDIQGRDHFKDLIINGSLIFKCIINNMGGCGLNSFG